MKKNIKFIDLFAGIGGFHVALKQYAKENNKTIECVFVSEIDKRAIETYSANHEINTQDIINIVEVDEDASQVPIHDILFAGFPCQSFSNAGNKMGFLDKTRGTLFFDIVKILQNKKPKYFLLENVKHLVKHDQGKTWKIICDTLRELGYIIPDEPLILNPYNFGIPQNRERVYIPGILASETNETKIHFDFSNFSKFVSDEQRIEDIRNNYLENQINEKYFLKNYINDNKLIKIIEAWGDFLKNVTVEENKTLPVIWADELNDDMSFKNQDLPKWKKDYIANNKLIYMKNKNFINNWKQKNNVDLWSKREKKFEWQAGRIEKNIKNSHIQIRQSGIRCGRRTKFPTLVAMVQTPIIFDINFNEWRKLTPRETICLQSFPKTFKTYNEIQMDNNDHYAYKQHGNSINVYVVKLIIDELLKY